MPTVHANRLKGNYGAAVVMARLSGECLVRPVAVDTDTGVDLYCETVAEGQPFLHFWVQVKAGDQCKVDLATCKASCSFEEDHLAYWARQPVPVFAALVPTGWPVSGEPDVYVVDITTQLLFAERSSPQNSRRLRSDYHWPARDPEPVRTFLRQVVPSTTARLQCSRGVVAQSPTPTPQYVREIPAVPVARFASEIRDQLRTTAAQSILFAIGSGHPTPEGKELSRLLARIVEQFGDDPHWENFMARALSSHADEDYGAALRLYVKARESIEADPAVRDQPPWREQVQKIRRLEEVARDRKLL